MSERRSKSPRMDSIDRKGRWAPPGGRELYFHSHLSDVPGESDSDGLEDVFEAANVTFVGAVLDYESDHNIPNVGAAADSKYLDFVEQQLRTLIKPPQAKLVGSEESHHRAAHAAIAAEDDARINAAREVVEQILRESSEALKQLEHPGDIAADPDGAEPPSRR